MEKEELKKSLEFLLKDEVEAISGYQQVIAKLDPDCPFIKELSEIMKDEGDHKEKLESMISEMHWDEERTEESRPVKFNAFIDPSKIKEDVKKELDKKIDEK